MTDLTPEAKALLRHARTAFSPPERRLESVRLALKGQIAASSASSGATPATSGPASGIAPRAIGAAGWSGGHSLAAAVVVGALGGGAVWLAAARWNPAPVAPIEAPSQIELANAARAAPSAPLSDTPVTSLTEPTLQVSPADAPPSSKSSAALRDRARVTRPRPKAETPHEAPVDAPTVGPTPVPPAPSDSLAEEVSMLRGARAALDRADAAQALRLLEAHEARFPRATLYEERLATRVLALCALGHIDAARSTAHELEQAAPRSPHLPRVRASCVAPTSNK